METGKTTAAVLLGVGIGALLGVLFAPEKGSKTRRKMMEKGQDYGDELQAKFDNLLSDVTDKYDMLMAEAKTIVAPKQ